MAQGLDYAFSHPDLACAKSRGYSFVARYVGDPDPNGLKYLDAAELAGIRAAGLSVVAVRETSAGFMLTDSGAAHARASRSHCNALGLRGIPIYYALDVDPRGLTAVQREAVTRFLQDAAAADGGENVGLYGSDDAIDWWAGTDYCRWGWQTYAWSGGRISPKAHFRQYLNGQSLCGGTVDLNETYTADFGQWPRPQGEDMPLDDTDLWKVKETVKTAMREAINDPADPFRHAIGASFAYWCSEDEAWKESVRDAVRPLLADLNVTVNVTDEQIEAVVRKVFADAGEA